MYYPVLYPVEVNPVDVNPACGANTPHPDRSYRCIAVRSVPQRCAYMESFYRGTGNPRRRCYHHLFPDSLRTDLGAGNGVFSQLFHLLLCRPVCAAANRSVPASATGHDDRVAPSVSRVHFRR